MKIQNDFSGASTFTLAQLRTVLLLVLLLLFALLGYRIQLMNSTERALAKIDNEIALAESAFSSYQRVRTSVFVRDHAEMSRRVALLNSLAPVKSYPPTHILARLEELLPSDVLLNQYIQKQGGETIDIGVAANDSLSLTAFVHNLEAEEAFRQVLIVRQSSDRAGLQSYEIRLTLK